MNRPNIPIPALQSRGQEAIRTMDEWRDRRKAVNQGFVEGKSAWEIANAWVGTGVPRVPDEFQALLDSHVHVRGTGVQLGVVEQKTPLRFSSGPRNHDLLLYGNHNGKKVVIGVEAKADDGLATSLRQDLLGAAKLIRIRKRTNKPARLDWLTQCLLGLRIPFAGELSGSMEYEQMLSDEIFDLPYQLFAGVAGTLLEAKTHQAGIAIFVVHQFRTRYTSEAKIRKDELLFDQFVLQLKKANPGPAHLSGSLEWGKLVGPIQLVQRECGASEWDMPASIPLYLGKVITG